MSDVLLKEAHDIFLSVAPRGCSINGPKIASMMNGTKMVVCYFYNFTADRPAHHPKAWQWVEAANVLDRPDEFLEKARAVSLRSTTTARPILPAMRRRSTATSSATGAKK